MTPTEQINRTAIHHLAKQQLARLLPGEHPENDATDWSRKASKAMDVFRDVIRDATRKMDEGRITAEDAVEFIDQCKAGIDVLMWLDG